MIPSPSDQRPVVGWLRQGTAAVQRDEAMMKVLLCLSLAGFLAAVAAPCGAHSALTVQPLFQARHSSGLPSHLDSALFLNASDSTGARSAEIGSSGAFTKSPHGYKNPVLSWALSCLVFPGTGQFYNGDDSRGAVMAGTAAAGLTYAIASFSHHFMRPTSHSGDDGSMVDAIVAIIVIADWAWSSVDAPRRSHAINRERGLACSPVGPKSASIGVASTCDESILPPCRLELVRLTF